MKKITTFAVALIAGLAIGIGQAEDKGGKGKGKGKGMDPAKRAEMILKQTDKDGDGKISKKEFTASKFAEKLNSRKEGAAEKMFAAMDKNKDGSLDKKELSHPPKGGPKGSGKKGKGGDEGDKKAE